MPPGGDRLQYVNGSWICVCASSWFGTECTSVYNVTTLAGDGNRGFVDGAGTAAEFNYPTGVAVDSAGNVYVADNIRIRVVSPSGTVSTLAGSGAAGASAGFANGVGPAAQFYNPAGVAVDTAGNVYVADYNNNLIRVVSPSGTVSTLAGSGGGFANGPGPSSRFYTPTGVAVDTAGNVYVADYGNIRIRKLIMFATSNASLPQQTAPASPLVTSLSALATQLAAQEATTVSLQQAQQPPLCMPPGGDRLLYNGSAWVCLCFAGWTGTSCTVSPSPPPPPSPPPSPPSSSPFNAYSYFRANNDCGLDYLTVPGYGGVDKGDNDGCFSFCRLAPFAEYFVTTGTSCWCLTAAGNHNYVGFNCYQMYTL
jgi:hypothetical protein